jgi:hypothetical protein
MKLMRISMKLMSDRITSVPLRNGVDFSPATTWMDSEISHGDEADAIST